MTASSSGIVRTRCSAPVNVQVARTSLAIFESFRGLLDNDPEASPGLVRSGYLIVTPPGASSVTEDGDSGFFTAADDTFARVLGTVYTSLS